MINFQAMMVVTANSKAAVVTWLVILVCAAGMVRNAAAQGCPNTFFGALAQLMPCRPAVEPLSQAHPSDACCNAVRLLGQHCLCLLVNGPPVSGVDRNMAMQLPGKCVANFEPCNGGV